MLALQLLIADFRNSRHCGVGHCYSRSKESVAEAIGAIYSRTKEAFRGNISGKHIDLTRQGNCLRQSRPLEPTLAITRFDIRRNRSRETFRRRSNLIRDRQIQHFSQSKKSCRIGKLSHALTLSFFGFGLFRETNSAHAVMTGSRLHFTLDSRQDSIDMLHSLPQGHAITAIGCNQRLMHVSPSAGTSVLRRLEKHSRTAQAEYMHAQ